MSFCSNSDFLFNFSEMYCIYITTRWHRSQGKINEPMQFPRNSFKSQATVHSCDINLEVAQINSYPFELSVKH